MRVFIHFFYHYHLKFVSVEESCLNYNNFFKNLLWFISVGLLFIYSCLLKYFFAFNCLSSVGFRFLLLSEND